MNKEEIDFKFLYPNLIIFLSSDPTESLFKKIKKSFNEFQYGPLFKEEGTYYKHELGRQVSTCRIKQGSGNPLCLAEGEGNVPCDAEQQAVERLFNVLCDNFYVIEANPQYMKCKNIPLHVLNADPTQSHIYKVVYLKNNSHGTVFPKPVSGAIDYVENYDDLMKYIENHAKSNSKADLFILNILKADRKTVGSVCKENGLTVKNLVGCSDMGMYAFHNMSTFMVLQRLLKDGGKNVKYRLIGPRDKYGDKEVKKNIEDNAGVEDFKVEAGGLEQPSQDDGEIVINEWIADHLVLMDVVTEQNELESTREIIWRSVRDCPDTQEFIIEKKRNNTGMILAEALIDRNIVGKARSYQEKRVKLDAAQNAMQNLSKYCYYIEAKRSYFGSKQNTPYFLQKPNPIPETNIYRIADTNRGPPNKILHKFKAARQEDLYFLDDFTKPERVKISNLAKKMNFLVRWIGRQSYLCVYKRRKPKDVLMELLSMQSKENAKYKLITPLSKSHQQMEGRAAHDDWTNQGVPHGTQSDIQPVEEPYSTTSVPVTQDYTTNLESSQVDRGITSESSAQSSEAWGQGKDEIPNWVKSFIESAPMKNVKKLQVTKCRPRGPKGPKDDVFSKFKFMPPRTIPPPFPSPNVNFQRPIRNVPSPVTGHGEIHEEAPEVIKRTDDNVFSRYTFIPPKTNPSPFPVTNVHFERPNQNCSPQVPSSNVNFDGTNQRPNQNIERNKTNPSRDKNEASTLSERLQRCLEQRNLSNSQGWDNGQNKQAPLNTSYKRTLSEEKKEWEPSEKVSKTTNSNISFQMQSSKQEWSNEEIKKEPENICSSLFYRRSELSQQNSSQGPCYDNSFEMQNCKQEWSNKEIEKESEKGTSTLFEKRPEIKQENNPLWDQGTKRQYDQRPNTSTGGPRLPNTSTGGPRFSNLFDFDGPHSAAPQGYPRTPFPPRPPPPWKLNKQFKGHKFSKLEKYGKKKGPRASY